MKLEGGQVDLKKDVKPITYLKNRTADLVREVTEGGRTMMITQNGEAKVVVMDVETYDRWHSAMALLKILAHAEADVDSGRTVKQEQAFDRALQRIRSSRHEA